MCERKAFYVDFSSWRIMAETEQEAVEKVHTYMREGNIPRIVSLDNSCDPMEGDELETESLPPEAGRLR